MNRIKRGAFLTMDSLEGFFCSDHLTYEPLAKLGWEMDEVSWMRQDVNWDDFDLVVICSPWDYSNHPRAFMSARTNRSFECASSQSTQHRALESR